MKKGAQPHPNTITPAYAAVASGRHRAVTQLKSSYSPIQQDHKKSRLEAAAQGKSNNPSITVTPIPALNNPNIKIAPIPADDYNLTETKRGFKEYGELLNMSIIGTINRLYYNFGKISVLDSGCGKGVFCSELLWSSSTRYKISQVYGISKDYFSNISIVQKNWPLNFTFYHGIVQEVLRKNPIKVHLIFDVWGPFSYSLKKMEILKLYYESLEVCGRAYIYMGDCFFPYSQREHPKPQISFQSNDGVSQISGSIIPTLVRRYPDHFQEDKTHPNILIMYKITDYCPFDKFKHKSSGLGITIYDNALDNAMQGNATMPADVVIVEEESAPKIKHGLFAA